MEERLWSALQSSGCSCVPLLKENFASPWHLACAVEDEEDSGRLVAQISENLSHSECQKEGKFIWAWISKEAALLERLQRQILYKARRIDYGGITRRNLAEIFERLVSGSVSLQKQVSRSQLR